MKLKGKSVEGSKHKQWSGAQEWQEFALRRMDGGVSTICIVCTSIGTRLRYSILNFHSPAHLPFLTLLLPPNSFQKLPLAFPIVRAPPPRPCPPLSFYLTSVPPSSSIPHGPSPHLSVKNQLPNFSAMSEAKTDSESKEEDMYADSKDFGDDHKRSYDDDDAKHTQQYPETGTGAALQPYEGGGGGGDDHEVDQEYDDALLYNPPLTLPQFILCYDDVKELDYLFHPMTGECVYVHNDHGDASGANRAFSFWTRPLESFPGGGTTREFRDDVSWNRHVYRMRGVLMADPERDARARKFEDADSAATAIQGLARQAFARAAVRAIIRETFEKRYDEGTFLHYFVNTRTGDTQWHRPVGLGQSAEHDIPEEGLYLEQEKEHELPPVALLEIGDGGGGGGGGDDAVVVRASSSIVELEDMLGYSVSSTPRSKKALKKTYGNMQGAMK